MMHWKPPAHGRAVDTEIHCSLAETGRAGHSTCRSAVFGDIIGDLKGVALRSQALEL
jgi:hypothetical protein